MNTPAVLGDGAYGCVLNGTDERAYKIVHACSKSTIRELQALKLLGHHPSVLAPLELISIDKQDDGRILAIVLPRITMSIRDMLHCGCSEERVRSVAKAGLSIIQLAVASGLIIRDICAANVLVEPSDESSCWFIDFGLATHVSKAGSRELWSEYERFSSDVDYHPSEFYDTEDPQPTRDKLDVYMLGVLLRKMLDACNCAGAPELENLVEGMTRPDYSSRLSLADCLSHPAIAPGILIVPPQPPPPEPTGLPDESVCAYLTAVALQHEIPQSTLDSAFRLCAQFAEFFSTGYSSLFKHQYALAALYLQSKWLDVHAPSARALTVRGRQAAGRLRCLAIEALKHPKLILVPPK